MVHEATGAATVRVAAHSLAGVTANATGESKELIRLKVEKRK